MMKANKKFIVLALVISLTAALFLLAGCGSGNGGGDEGGSGSSGAGPVDTAIKGAAEYLAENAEEDSADSMGGGWAPFALKLSGTDAVDDDYYENYYNSIRLAVKGSGAVLSKDSPTANERVSMNLQVLGKDPTSVEGEDLMAVVDDYDVITYQGLNAEIYALISADYTGYKLKNESKYLDDLIASQLPDGAFGMSSEHPDVDMTAMAIQALSIYDSRIEGNDKSDARAEGAIDRALEWLEPKQEEDGSYGNAESTAQVIIAMGCLGRDPEKDGFTNDSGKTLVDGLLVYDTGNGFSHKAGDEAEMLSTEQSLMALDAVKLAQEGKRIFG